MVIVLFICVQNAGRSQIAEAIFNKLSDGSHRAISAGSNPAEKVNPIVVEALTDLGIDISDKKPKKLTKEIVQESDIAITMGCGYDVCPVVPNELREWKIDDPKDKSLVDVRVIRDDIYKKVSNLLSELDETR